MAKINAERLMQSIREQGAIGWQEAGLFREGFTENFFAVRDYVQKDLEAHGIATRIDSLGNLFGIVPGKNPESIILSGSHLDSVKAGGILDGAYGVMAAVEIAKCLKEQNITLEHSFEVVGFNAEEGSDLGGSFGSRAFSGMMKEYPPQDVLAKYKLTEKDIDDAKGQLQKYAAFLELHIEQGIVLHENSIALGVPTAIAGITRYSCKVFGRSNHSGTTPMQMRKDALFETMQAMTAWMEYMRKEETMVCNIGYMNVKPGHICVVPEEVEFTVEMRAIDHKDIERGAAYLEECFQNMPTCTASVSLQIDKPSAALHEGLAQSIYETGLSQGYSIQKMISGASHDASPISYVMPTAMIFVPSVDGISHAPEEFTSEQDLIMGTQLLMDSLLSMDKQAL